MERNVRHECGSGANLSERGGQGKINEAEFMPKYSWTFRRRGIERILNDFPDEKDSVLSLDGVSC
jgi:hypothetical protein